MPAKQPKTTEPYVTPLRQWRETKNWTQAALAEKLGVRQATVHFWEKGKWPIARHRQLIQDLTGVSCFDLLPKSAPVAQYKMQEDMNLDD